MAGGIGVMAEGSHKYIDKVVTNTNKSNQKPIHK